jgi:hypothetical protein
VLGACQAIAIEAVARIDALFAIEREINGMIPRERLSVRTERSRPLILELEAWLREQRGKLSSKNDTAKAINTVSSAGQRSPGSSMTVGYACQTMRPSGRSAAWRSDATTGPSPAPTKVVGALTPSTP